VGGGSTLFTILVYPPVVVHSARKRKERKREEKGEGPPFLPICAFILLSHTLVYPDITPCVLIPPVQKCFSLLFLLRSVYAPVANLLFIPALQIFVCPPKVYQILLLLFPNIEKMCVAVVVKGLRTSCYTPYP